MKRKFWNWIRNEDESVSERTLFLNGQISDETWYGDEVTPQLFKDELNAGTGNITVWINSGWRRICGGTDLQHAS